MLVWGTWVLQGGRCDYKTERGGITLGMCNLHVRGKSFRHQLRLDPMYLADKLGGDLMDAAQALLVLHVSL
jgi:hypothetical protein